RCSKPPWSPREAFLAWRHGPQRLGSLVKPSWPYRSCSPLEKVNSLPQSTHVICLSVIMRILSSVSKNENRRRPRPGTPLRYVRLPAAAPAPPPAPAAAAAVGALGPGTGLVDRHGPPADLLEVEGADGRLSCAVVRHLDESEPPRPARHLVHDDLDRRHLAVGLEGLAAIVLGRLIPQIADIDVHHLLP